MPRTPAIVVLVGLVAGCAPDRPPTPTPNAHQKLPISVSMDLAGVSASEITADASYQTLNNGACLHATGGVAGYVPTGHRQIDIPVRRIGERYVTSAYADHFLVQRYFRDKPACVWTLTAMRFQFGVAGTRYMAFGNFNKEMRGSREARLRCYKGRAVEGRSMCIPDDSPAAVEGEYFPVVLAASPGPPAAITSLRNEEAK